MFNRMYILLIGAVVTVSVAAVFFNIIPSAQTPISGISICTSSQVITITSGGLKCIEIKDAVKSAFSCSAGQILRLSSSGYLRCGDNAATAVPTGDSIVGDTTKKADLTCRSNQVVTATENGIECRNIGHILRRLLIPAVQKRYSSLIAPSTFAALRTGAIPPPVPRL